MLEALMDSVMDDWKQYIISIRDQFEEALALLPDSLPLKAKWCTEWQES